MGQERHFAPSHRYKWQSSAARHCMVLAMDRRINGDD
jgi:hypothetical protein